MNIAYNADCLDIMRNMPNDYIDLTVTSPPYDNLRTYNGFNFDWQKTIQQLYRITKDGGVVVWIVNDATVNGSETGTSFKQALYAKECGFNLHDTMIWQKDGIAFPETNRYYPIFEYMFVWSKGKPKTFNGICDRKNKHCGTLVHGTNRQLDGTLKNVSGAKLGRKVKEYGTRFNVWKISSEHNNKTGHPAVFPLQLAKDHILSWSKEGDVIFDPFLGSGTTRLAAFDLNRQFIGCEISKEYFDKQEERFNIYTSMSSTN